MSLTLGKKSTPSASKVVAGGPRDAPSGSSGTRGSGLMVLTSSETEQDAVCGGKGLLAEKRTAKTWKRSLRSGQES